MFINPLKEISFMDSQLINKIIMGSLGAVFLFYLLAYVILPSFGSVYEHCGMNNPYSAGNGGSDLNNACCQTGSSTVITCANCNNTVGYSTFLSSCSSLIATTNGTNCYQCASFGNKGLYQGLFFILFIIIIFSFIMLYVYQVVKKKRR
jgi:hypothetical protein